MASRDVPAPRGRPARRWGVAEGARHPAGPPGHSTQQLTLASEPSEAPPLWPLECQSTEGEAGTGRRQAVLTAPTGPQLSSYVLPSLTHRPFFWPRGQNFGSGPCSGPPPAHATQAPWPGSPGLCSGVWPGLSSHQPWSLAPRSPRSPGPRERRPAGAPGPVKTLQFPRAVSSAPSAHPTQSNSSSAFKTPGAPLIRLALSAVRPCL